MADGNYTKLNFLNETDFLSNTEVEYTCNEGFYMDLVNESILICASSGYWIGLPLPICIEGTGQGILINLHRSIKDSLH